MHPKLAKIAKDLGVQIVVDHDLPCSGQSDCHRTIQLKRKNARAIVVLHEIGHTICGAGCCREHDEFRAHGAAEALAKLYGIRLSPADRRMVKHYAGWSLHRFCTAIPEGRE